MSYDVGTHIDLRYLNRKAEVSQPAPKKSFQEATSNLFEVGTQFVFSKQGAKASRRIQVVYA